MEFIKVKPSASLPATFLQKCPKCGRIAKFAVIRHGSALNLLGQKVKTLHDHSTAVCGECAARFTLNAEKAARLKRKEMTFITVEDLEEN